MEITQKLNIPKKEVGDKFYAEEVNQIVNAINDNSTKIDNNANQITELKNQKTYNVDNITAKRINVDENLYVNKYLSNQAGDTFALKGNNVEGADYTLITDQDLGDYAKKNDTTQIIKAQSLEVNDGIKFYTNRDAMSMAVSKLYGDFDDNQMPFLDFLGENGQPRLTNIADPLNATDAATKGYVDKMGIGNYTLLATVETGTEATTEKNFKLLQSCGGYKKIVIYMERNGTKLSFRNVYINIGGRSLMLVSTPANAKRCLFEIELDRTLSIGKFYHHSNTESYITTFNALQATAIRTNMNTLGTLVFNYYDSSVEPNVKFTIYGR